MCSRSENENGGALQNACVDWAATGGDSAAPPRSDNGGKVFDEEMRWPEEPGAVNLAVLLYRRWTYSYMGRILKRGAARHRRKGDDGGTSHNLTQDDLYRAPKTMENSYLDARFASIYDDEGGHLLKTLWRLAAPTFVPAALCQLLTVFAQTSIPLLVMRVLTMLEDNPRQNIVKEGGMTYVILIFLASVLNALATHRQRQLATQSGIVIRMAVVSAVYRQVLNLTPDGRSGLTVGEITNLVAVDTQKLYEVMQEGHMIWSCPLSIVLVSILLVIILGPTTLVGIAVLTAFGPLTTTVTAKMISIRKRRVRIADERVEVINAMLQGMKVTKLNNYESKYLQRITEARERELSLLRRELYVWSGTLTLMVITPVLASAVTYITFVLVNEDNILTASKTFTTLLLFSALRFPINYAGRLIGKAAQAYESAKRISSFLRRKTRDASLNRGDENHKDWPLEQPKCGSILEVRNGTFRVGGNVKIAGDKSDWEDIQPGSHDGGFTLANVNFSVGRGEVLAIVGAVASGKTTLISGIIDEVPCGPSKVLRTGRVAYAGQTPFILNATLRENILFGRPYDEPRYEKVLRACCLLQDIAQLGQAGDLTEIGERGITLSGGQKQRVSLARVAYSQADLALLDDPLSALDAGTSSKVFDQLIRCPDPDLLGKSAVVLVTHAAHMLHRVDKILVLVDGRSVFCATWDELSAFKSKDQSAVTAIEAIRNTVQEKSGRHDDDAVSETSKVPHNGKISISNNLNLKGGLDLGTDVTKSGKLIETERREHGLSSIRIWLWWFKYAGGLTNVLILILALGIDRTAYVATEWWLARWTQAGEEPISIFGSNFPAQNDGRASQSQYLRVYCAILIISFLATCQRSLWAVRGGALCAKSLFYMMTERVLNAPLTYFEVTPLGRVLNRFTYDIEVLDRTLVENMSTMLIAWSWFVAGVVVMTVILPFILLALIPVTVLYWLLQLHYRKSGADLQRLDAVSRSPMQAMLAEGIDGAATIRVYGQEQRFRNEFQARAYINTSAQLNFITAERWLGVRTELLGALIVLASTTLVVVFNDVFAIDTGLVAMLVIWSSNYNITLGFLMENGAEAEAAMTSVERIRDMTELSQEKSMITESDCRPPDTWPSKGNLEFLDVALRYRPGLPFALKGLSFTVEPGQRCGVVGRTGAGKSSLAVALFRLVEVESGSIFLDGVDLATLGLSDIRGRRNGLAIIPQDPVLIKGSIRQVLDPFGDSSDKEIFEALQCVRLDHGRDIGVLESPVDEGGANHSVGERQLLCMARAMLSKPRLLVLDEATASVDGETDAFVQKMLRTRFRNTTLLTVAHRLNTIMDYDRVLVMSDGRAVEFGPPLKLLENEDGLFSELVRNTGMKK